MQSNAFGQVIQTFRRTSQVVDCSKSQRLPFTYKSVSGTTGTSARSINPVDDFTSAFCVENPTLAPSAVVLPDLPLNDSIRGTPVVLPYQHYTRLSLMELSPLFLSILLLNRFVLLYLLLRQRYHSMLWQMLLPIHPPLRWRHQSILR